uniref:23S rRNA pseudouridine2605 synthase n=1 Tax=Candidatus Kentrum sp. SD TaxID=2126332 RepID=A0A450YNJ4_9GAMM|nr:MAG: 23S rRNA pseudouridine2605 synthase [Candidatus Kentron sp. SD]VFK43092.1 MAG: 23S rRNA pseudouridine2605 synthase [Candidatus Kentron sp. SD]
MDKTPKRPSRKSHPEPRRKNPRPAAPRGKPASANPKHLPTEKLQKVLAETGLESRRALEGWIEAGRVSVNGAPAKLGARVRATDRIQVDGREISRRAPGAGRLRVLRYHKPVGEICSRLDPEGRRSVFQRLPDIPGARWVMVGRLDINTSGLLLFTNAGDLAHRLMHPSSDIEREYAVRVLPWESEEDARQSPSDARRGADDENGIAPNIIARLREGVRLEDGLARFECIVDAGGQGRNHWYHVTIKEGKTHEVRRLWEAVGLRVSRLIRLRYGPIRLGRALRPGRWEELSPGESAALAKSVGLGKLAGGASPRPKRHRTTDPESGASPRPNRRRTTGPESGASPRPKRHRATSPESGASPRPKRHRTTGPESGASPRPKRHRATSPESDASPRPKRHRATSPESSASPRSNRRRTTGPEKRNVVGRRNVVARRANPRGSPPGRSR